MSYLREGVSAIYARGDSLLNRVLGSHSDLATGTREELLRHNAKQLDIEDDTISEEQFLVELTDRLEQRHRDLETAPTGWRQWPFAIRKKPDESSYIGWRLPGLIGGSAYAIGKAATPELANPAYIEQHIVAPGFAISVGAATVASFGMPTMANRIRRYRANIDEMADVYDSVLAETNGPGYEGLIDGVNAVREATNGSINEIYPHPTGAIEKRWKIDEEAGFWVTDEVPKSWYSLRHYAPEPVVEQDTLDAAAYANDFAAHRAAEGIR